MSNTLGAGLLLLASAFSFSAQAAQVFCIAANRLLPGS